MGLSIPEVARQLASKSGDVVDYVSKPTPLMATAGYIPATNGLRHAFEVLESVIGAGFINLDDAGTTVDATTRLDWKDLNVMGGKIACGFDTAKTFGGFASYIARKEQAIYNKTFRDTESVLIYNILRQYAIDKGKFFSAVESDTNANKYNTILAVRWEDDNMCGLYDSSEGAFDQGTFLSTIRMNGGDPVEASGRLEYQAQMRGYLGFLTANPDNICAITNIPEGTPAASLENLINAALEEAHEGWNGRTYLFMHPRLQTLVGSAFKNSINKTAQASTVYNGIIQTWNNTELVGSYQFNKNAEAYVPLTGRLTL